jgi:mannose-6-phosphate isomerase-like protein (cupin superfamily)
MNIIQKIGQLLTEDPNVFEEAEVEAKNDFHGFVENIEDLSVKNAYFRQVLYTAENCQLVVMSLKPKEEIGVEVHTVDQFFRVEEGEGTAIINGIQTALKAGSGIIVPAGAEHNIIAGDAVLKLYTIYSPPHHKDGTVHKTKKDAKADKDHFDGETTE